MNVIYRNKKNHNHAIKKRVIRSLWTLLAAIVLAGAYFGGMSWLFTLIGHR